MNALDLADRVVTARFTRKEDERIKPQIGYKPRELCTYQGAEVYRAIDGAYVRYSVVGDNNTEVLDLLRQYAKA